MDNKTFCGQCGIANPIVNIYCFKCGQKLLQAADGFTLPDDKPAKNSDYLDIKETLQRLIKTNGFSTIFIGDYYVQFSNDITTKQLYCEAVSSVFLPSVGHKDKEFTQLGFVPDPNANYFKFISHSDFSVDKIVNEIKTIFETIYHIKFADYKIESDFEDAVIKQTVQVTHPTSAPNKQNKNFGCLAIIIIAAIIGIYTAISGDSEKKGSYNTEIVSNSPYDASVYQVEQFLKEEYLKDPDSYEGIEWSKVQTDNSNSLFKYYVRHKYRAKNSFGGYVIEEKIFYLDHTGNVVNVTNF